MEVRSRPGTADGEARSLSLSLALLASLPELARPEWFLEALRIGSCLGEIGLVSRSTGRAE